MPEWVAIREEGENGAQYIVTHQPILTEIHQVDVIYGLLAVVLALRLAIS